MGESRPGPHGHGPPVLDGWEATRRLKAAQETGSIPILALTAYTASSDLDKAREAGCDDYGTKPIEFLGLLGMVESSWAEIVNYDHPRI